MVREPSFDFSGAAPQKFVAVDGLSIQVMASNLSVLNCSVTESVIKSGTVDDSANILTLCASTFAVGGRRVSTSGLESGMTTGPSCDFGVIALQAVVTMDGLSSPVSTSSLSEPSCLVAECVTEGGAVDDSADILAACDGTTPPEGLRASTSGLDSGVVTKMSFDLTRYIVYRYIWSTPHLQCTPHVWSTALLCCTCVYGCSIIFM